MKDFFNSTAPLNMAKYNNLQQHQHQQHNLMADPSGAPGGPSSFSHYDFNSNQQQQHQWGERTTSVGSNSTQNLKRLSNNYYSKQHHLQQSLSPVKKGAAATTNTSKGKKQMLIQSILNQDATLTKPNNNYLLNQTLQQLILQQQQQAQLMQSQEIIQQVLKKQQQQQKRLNKTLDNYQSVPTKQQSKQRQSLNLNEGGGGGGRGSIARSTTKLSSHQNNNLYQAFKQSNSAQKNTFSSTMRISDFNQTQQFTTTAASGPQQYNQDHLLLLSSNPHLHLHAPHQETGDVGRLVMDYGNASGGHPRKSTCGGSQPNKNPDSGSLKQTQNLNFNYDVALDAKASAMSIYTGNNNQRQMVGGADCGSSSLQKKKSQEGFKQQQSHHRKQTSQDNQHSNNGNVQERELLKKMMNFYQDDFLTQFKPQIGGVGAVAANQPDSKGLVTMVMGGRQSVGAGGGPSKGLKHQQQHKANSTLNQYIGGGEWAGSAGAAKQSEKEFQNKTQPIPKSILEMAAQLVNHNNHNQNNVQQQQQHVNLSTGTSINNINGNAAVVMKAVSRDSIGAANVKQQSMTRVHPGKNSSASKSSANKNTNNNNKRASINSGSCARKQQQNCSDNNPPAPAAYGTGNAGRQPEADQDNNKYMILKAEGDGRGHHIDQQNDKVSDSCGSSFSDEGLAKLSRFILGKQIGQGAYAVVRIATCKKDNKKYAIKVYDKAKLTDSNRQRSVRREIKLLQKMNHQNIVKIYEAFETDDHVYLVMEYVGGGSLHSYLREKPNRRLEEEDSKRIFKQIMTALQYCHRKSIAHRDIKLENILLDEDNNVKLIDFGFSTCIPNDKKIKMFCGTPSYMAPEIVMKEEYAGPPADIWASAVLLYALMNGCFPYRGATDKELYRRIQRGTFVMHNQNGVTTTFVEFLIRMLNIVADERPTADEILSDPWFQIDSEAQAQAERAQSIADQKRLFKAKILGKIPVEKDNKSNTICLNSTSEAAKVNSLLRTNVRVQGGAASGGGAVQISGSGTIAQAHGTTNNYQGSNNIAQSGVAVDFSDYGLQQQNVMKRLNQEAYQAYYNTSGGNYGLSGTGTIQNPYYNNFFQNNFLGNQNPTATGGQISGAQPQTVAGGIYPIGPNNNSGNTYQLRQSPNKQIPPILGGNGGASAAYHPMHNNANQQIGGTPQVFGSPTGGAFHCSGGLINNNFNIINNIIMNQGGASEPSSSQVGSNSNNPQVQVHVTSPHAMAKPAGGLNTNSGGLVDTQPIVNGSIINLNLPAVGEQNEEVLLLGEGNSSQEDDIDEEIVDNMAKLGYNRSQVISHVLGVEKEGDGGVSSAEYNQKLRVSQIGKIYQKLKEEKLSKTSTNKNHRALSLNHQKQQFGRKLLISTTTKQGSLGKHQLGVFPNNYVPSVPADEEFKSFEGTQKIQPLKNTYYENLGGQNNNNTYDDDYNIMVLSSQKSPKSGTKFNQTLPHPLFQTHGNAPNHGMHSGIVGAKY